MQLDVDTEAGPARLTVDAPDSAARPRAVLWLGHGAGGGIGGPDLLAIARALPLRGISVVRHEQPWRVAGRRVASRPAALDAAWLQSAAAVAGLVPGAPLIVGGRSAGARVACRTAAEVGAIGVLCLAFPLRPPSTPDRTRLPELLTPDVPVLVLQGERDTFGTAATVAAEVEAAQSPNVRVVTVPGADHSMKVLARSAVPPREVAALIASTVADFLDDLLAGPREHLVR
ncbi:MAG: hydrolase [Naasia sp.]|uniref:alpha/beta hydrolase family protein n=1 Tax=Naasia sp. TaxID=2546198 RepID=UPI002639897B|nr:alpha/beta family hydrolase [Naasia sp.]MCU1569385.1 hydrolase [Naasia sp.]